MIELLVLALAPAVFILWYVLRKDRYEPEPLRLVLWIFLLGALAVIPAALIESPFSDTLVLGSVVAPVVEELAKFSVVFLFVYHRAEFNEPMDGIVYAAAASLGFASVENLVYVLDGGAAVGLLRAVASVPGHVIFSCVWGAALGIAKFRPASRRAGIIVVGLFGAMLLHGIFNFSLEVFGVAGLLLILVVIVPGGWWLTGRSIRNAHADPSSALSALRQLHNERNGVVHVTAPAGTGEKGDAPRFCTGCGGRIPAGTDFCTGCGKKV
jgi:RsiW-degrading membrane proteinase PrsW (M82 family)